MKVTFFAAERKKNFLEENLRGGAGGSALLLKGKTESLLNTCSDIDQVTKTEGKVER